LLGTKTLLENQFVGGRFDEQKFIAVFVLLVAIVAVGLAGMAQDASTEAPAGFDTPTLVQNPGSQSHSNAIAQPAGDAYANDQKVYETSHDPNTGLGPVFNTRASSDCHQNPVSGGASPFTELRVDLKSLTLENAIERHKGEAEHAKPLSAVGISQTSANLLQ
jgi:hypothetical protein